MGCGRRDADCTGRGKSGITTEGTKVHKGNTSRPMQL
jgi:hypothetical protein